MAGYIRQSAGSIVALAEITAAPLNAEFNQLAAAFHGTTGHVHDGSTGNGPKISLTGSVSGILPAANGGTGAALTTVDNTIPRFNGTGGVLQTSNITISDTDDVSIPGNLTVTGSITMSGRAVDAFPSGTKTLFFNSAAPTGWTKDTTHDNKALRIVSGTPGSGGSVNFTTAFTSRSVAGSISSTTSTGTVGSTTLTTNQIPSHNHDFGTLAGSAASNGAHTHSVSGTAASDGAHTHSVSGSTSTDGAHQHGPNSGSTFWVNVIGVALQSGTSLGGFAQTALTDSSGSHSHTVSGTAASNGAHTHSVSATAASNGAHTHTISVTSGNTGSAGSGASHDHTLTMNSHSHTFTGTAIDLTVQYVDAIICTKN